MLDLKVLLDSNVILQFQTNIATHPEFKKNLSSGSIIGWGKREQRAGCQKKIVEITWNFKEKKSQGTVENALLLQQKVPIRLVCQPEKIQKFHLSKFLPSFRNLYLRSFRNIYTFYFWIFYKVQNLPPHVTYTIIILHHCKKGNSQVII